MRKMTAEQVIAHVAKHDDQRVFWARSDASGRWVLLDRVSARGIEYGMRSWEFCGPVLDPDQLGERKPDAWQSTSDPRFVTADEQEAKQWAHSGYRPRPLYQ